MSLYDDAEEYLSAGLRLIPLHPIIQGKCACGNPDCAAKGKHPLRANWQNQRLVDSAIFDVWRDVYQCNSLGWALDQDHIIIDIDPRNGGNESLVELQKDTGIILRDICNAIIKTGGGGIHFYFRKDETTLGWKLPSKYKGIDIKQAGGFVVIAGSFHASGNYYEWESANKFDLENLCKLPDEIATLLARGYDSHRETMQKEGMGDLAEIADMLTFISADVRYDDWVKIGMAVHHATGGSGDGAKVWDDWSKSGSSYKSGECDVKWHSFGKYNSKPAGMGSLVHIARLAGWEPKPDSTALSAEQLQEIKERWEQKKEDRVCLPSIADDHDIDIYEPPGLLGKIYDYVYSCSVFPRHTMAARCR